MYPPPSAPLVKCPRCHNTLGQLVDGEIVGTPRIRNGDGGRERRVFYARRVECERPGCGGVAEAPRTADDPLARAERTSSGKRQILPL